MGIDFYARDIRDKPRADIPPKMMIKGILFSAVFALPAIFFQFEKAFEQRSRAP